MRRLLGLHALRPSARRRRSRRAAGGRWNWQGRGLRHGRERGASCATASLLYRHTAARPGAWQRPPPPWLRTHTPAGGAAAGLSKLSIRPWPVLGALPPARVTLRLVNPSRRLPSAGGFAFHRSPRQTPLVHFDTPPAPRAGFARSRFEEPAGPRQGSRPLYIFCRSPPVSWAQEALPSQLRHSWTRAAVTAGVTRFAVVPRMRACRAACHAQKPHSARAGARLRVRQGQAGQDPLSGIRSSATGVGSHRTRGLAVPLGVGPMAGVRWRPPAQ